MEYDFLTQRLGDSRPTQFDSRVGVFSKAEPYADWFVVAGRNRDSKAIDISNFEVAQDMLESAGPHVNVLRFGHWACGWYELLIVDPSCGDTCKIADDILRALEGYPVLDDEHFSAKECELDECECDCCPKTWCDCASCVEHFKDAYGDIVL